MKLKQKDLFKLLDGFSTLWHIATVLTAQSRSSLTLRNRNREYSPTGFNQRQGERFDHLLEVNQSIHLAAPQPNLWVSQTYVI